MDISIFFKQIDINQIIEKDGLEENCLGNFIEINKGGSDFPEYLGCDIAILGVQDGRMSYMNEGTEKAPDIIRKNLYNLYKGSFSPKIVDLGNILKGDRIEDTYFALRDVCIELLGNNVLPVIIGGSKELTYSIYLAYKTLRKTVNLLTIDKSFKLETAIYDEKYKTFLNKIIQDEPNYLFNYCNMGYQTYYVDQKDIELMKKLYFDIYRLGKVRENIEDTEPIIRNADFLSFDISAVRNSDACGNYYSSPNGFHGEEACQFMWYAGNNDKLTSIGLYEYNPEFDIRQQTAQLMAQMIWYFIEGFSNRKNDFLFENDDNFIKYHVSIKGNNSDVIFYKSKKSNRWWLEISKSIENVQKKYMVPCSYNDYKVACNDELPDIWWKTYQKISLLH